MKELNEDVFPASGAPCKYDWKAILNGKPWLLLRGEDYHVSDSTMRNMIYGTAKKRDCHVAIRVCDEGLMVQARQREKGGEDES